MNIPMPIIIPISSNVEKCPKCNNAENKKTVCRNCGYEYKNEYFTIVQILFVIFIIIIALGVVLFILFSVFRWIDGQTLLEAAKENLNFILDLFKRIY